MSTTSPSRGKHPITRPGDGTASYRFGDFLLDPTDRRLSRDGKAVEVNARYFDALTLLVERHGELVTKDDFMDRVWRGVPVTDEALTQCVRTLRRSLDDNAAAPRFIATVPKHGYRFIASVAGGPQAIAAITPMPAGRWDSAIAGTFGGSAAGLLGGAIYGLLVTAVEPGAALSLFLVLTLATGLVGLAGGAGVAFGMTALERRGAWLVAGGAIGGMLTGALVNLIGVDALALLFGREAGGVTGAMEGALLGLSAGAGCWFARERGLRSGTALAMACGAMGGLAVALLDGHLMAGTLALLAHDQPGVGFRLGRLAGVAGEARFGPRTAAMTAALESALFAGGIAAARAVNRRQR